jgi:hypothetical protein
MVSYFCVETVLIPTFRDSRMRELSFAGKVSVNITQPPEIGFIRLTPGIHEQRKNQVWKGG